VALYAAAAAHVLNNIVEQDHRRVRRLVRPGLGFGRLRTARRTLAAFEARAMIGKRRVYNIDGHDIGAPRAFASLLLLNSRRPRLRASRLSVCNTTVYTMMASLGTTRP
jgi:hypothetical protein